MGAQSIDMAERLYRVLKPDGLVSDVLERNILLKQCCEKGVLVLVTHAGEGMETAGLAGMTMAKALFGKCNTMAKRRNVFCCMTGQNYDRPTEVRNPKQALPMITQIQFY